MNCLIFALLLLAHAWAGAGFERVDSVCRAVLSAHSKGVEGAPVRVASLRILAGQPTETQTRGVWVPPGTEGFPLADLDGNSKGDSRWAYEWDGENRLIRVTSQAGAVSAGAPYQMLTFRYDALGRLLERKEFGGSAAALVLSNTTTYLYGGWKNLCTWKAVGAGASTLQATQVWGLSELGGGIEGLLFYKSAANGAHACAYDGGGNLTGLVALSNGTVSGQYEYDAFGTLLRQGGVSAVEAENPWRFSTKRMDPVSGLMHYEYRAYNPALGRWLSRDPLGEEGGVNLLGFVGNSPVNSVDPDGRDNLSLHGQNAPVAATFIVSCRGDVQVEWPPQDFFIHLAEWAYSGTPGPAIAAIAHDTMLAADNEESKLERFSAGLRAGGTVVLALAGAGSACRAVALEEELAAMAATQAAKEAKYARYIDSLARDALDPAINGIQRSALEAASLRNEVSAVVRLNLKDAAGSVNCAPKGLGNQNTLFKNALQQFKNSDLSNAGRALTKHPEVVGATKEALRQGLRTDGAINEAAHEALKNIMRNGVTTTPTLGRYGTVTQIQIPGGFGARWNAPGEFIGFINP